MSHCTPISQNNPPLPAWAALADTLIDRLALHHNAGPRARTRRREGPPSELDQLLEAFNNQPGADKPTTPAGRPSRQAPARQVLAAIRIAAAFVSEAAVQETLPDGALTVLNGIDAADLLTVADVLAVAFPHQQWRIIAPDIVEDALAKGAAARLNRAIVDSLDVIKPVLILQPAGLALPPGAARPCAAAIHAGANLPRPHRPPARRRQSVTSAPAFG